MTDYDRRPESARLSYGGSQPSKGMPSNKIDYSSRQKVNAEFRKAGLDGNGRFREVGQAISVMTGILAKHGMELDDVPNAHLFMADQKAVNFNIAWTNKEDSFSPVEIANSVLHISYTKLREDAYEVVAYLS